MARTLKKIDHAKVVAGLKKAHRIKEIATACKVSESGVRAYIDRHKLRAEHWPKLGEVLELRFPGLVARLGKETDTQLAKEFTLSRQSISSYRQRLEIPSVVPVYVAPESTP